MGISFNNKKYAPFTGSTPTAKIYKGRTPIWDSSLFKILTQWKLVGNSEIMSIGNLTSWAMEGNSEVRDGQILSCGDYNEQTGKYDIRFTNGVSEYVISIDEPLRKVGDVADTIEYPTDEANTARVTRKVGSVDLGSLTYISVGTMSFMSRDVTSIQKSRMLCPIYKRVESYSNVIDTDKRCYIGGVNGDQLYISDSRYSSTEDFKRALQGVELLFELVESITSYIDVYPIKANNTYTCNNQLSWSKFTYDYDKAILSCGDLGEDGKYHVLIKADSKIIDIPLDEPLRKVGDVGDTIEFPTDTPNTAKVTRKVGSVDMGTLHYSKSTVESGTNTYNRFSIKLNNFKAPSTLEERYSLLFSPYYPTNSTPIIGPYASGNDKGISGYNNSSTIFIYDKLKSDFGSNEFRDSLSGITLLYVLADDYIATSYISVPNIPLAKAYSSENIVPYSEFDHKS